MAYPTLADLKGYVSEPTAETRHDATLSSALDAAIAKLEAYTDRYFGTDTNATEKLFLPISPYWTTIRDFYDTDGLVVKTDDNLDGTHETTWTHGTDFILGPFDQRPGYPYYRLQAVGSKIFPHPQKGRPTLSVTAKWGWAETPNDVFETVLELAAQIWKRRDAPFGVVGFDDMGPVQVSASDRRVLVKVDYLRRYGALVG